MRITDGKEFEDATGKSKFNQLENTQNPVQKDKKVSVVKQGEFEEQRRVKIRRS